VPVEQGRVGELLLDPAVRVHREAEQHGAASTVSSSYPPVTQVALGRDWCKVQMARGGVNSLFKFSMSFTKQQC
jgi:hypothetical protein